MSMMMKPNNHRRFTISRPWGYLATEVEEAMDRYENTIAMLNQRLEESLRQISVRDSRIEKLETELRAMHIEMSSLELPDVEELTESVVLSEFRNYPQGPAPIKCVDPPPVDGVHAVVTPPVGQLTDEERKQVEPAAMLLGQYDEDADEEEPGVGQGTHLRMRFGKRQERRQDETHGQGQTDDGDGFHIVT